MTGEREELKSYIERIEDESVVEKVKIFIMGILAQQKLEQKHGEASGNIPEH